MARTRAHRKYLLTINNPMEKGFTHEVIKTTLDSFSGCEYWCMSDEVGEQGTPHTHLYMAFRNPVEFLTVQQRFFGAHIDYARGKHRENRDYIRKEGKWLDSAKHETSIPGTFEESGDLPPEADSRQKQSEAVLAMLQDGASNSDILREYPTMMNHLRHVEEARQTLLEDEYRHTYRQLQVAYIWGKTGVGKTRSVMEQYGYENVFRVTNYVHPFDGYGGEDILLFDEFRSSLPVADMLKYLDGYPLLLPCRYSDKVACYTKVYLVSNIPMERQYPNVQREEPETWNAFLRRFNVGICEMLPAKQSLPDWAAF